MADISVLLIGASGILGKPLLDELVHQRGQFKRVAILTTPDRAAKFNELAGVEVVVGSLFEGNSYQGRFTVSHARLADSCTNALLQVLDLNMTSTLPSIE